MIPPDTILLRRSDVAALLQIEECMTAVEEAFKMRALGKAKAPGILGIHARDGGFHIKAGILNLDREYFVAKTNANFPANMVRHNLPTIQGVIVVSDALNGKLLAVMDSIEITIIRTGAATGVAAKYLATEDAKTITIIGCGNQGRISLKAIAKVRNIETVYAYDVDKLRAENFSKELSRELEISVKAVADFKQALKQSQICVTCTPSKKFFLTSEDLLPGTFIAAVGSDNEEKQELDPMLISANKIVVDSLEQCEIIGELHHAIELGFMNRESVYAELGEVIAGTKKGRERADEIIIFDSTGTALQDVAAAAIVFERAIQRGIGSKINFGQ
jgi:alanine dehydrogenase